MALSEESGGMVMPVAPAYGGNGGMFGNGDSWAWIILLLLLAGNGWGNNGYGGNGAGGLYPWLNQAEVTANGFQNSALNSAIAGIQSSVTSGFGDVQNALCGGFAGVNASITNAQIANMQTAFGLQSQLAQCCCDNRLATAQTQALVQSENCADRQALSDGIRDLIANQNANSQRIIDQLCADKIDAKNERIADLERQLTMANLSASQNAQTAQILANNEAQTTALEQYLAPVPRPAFIVQNPNGCGSTCGCGCGTF